MLRIQISSSGASRFAWLSSARRACAHRTGLTGVLFTFLVGFAAVSAAPAPKSRKARRAQAAGKAAEHQRQERASDWATDNLELFPPRPRRSGRCWPKIPA